MTLQFAFENLSDFFLMNGHGPYVWSSYAITFTVIAIMVTLPFMRRKTLIKLQRAQSLRESVIQQQDVSQEPNKSDEA